MPDTSKFRLGSRLNLLGVRRNFRYLAGNRDDTLRPDFAGRFAAEDAAFIVVMMELGTSDVPAPSGPHIHFRGGEHTD